MLLDDSSNARGTGGLADGSELLRADAVARHALSGEPSHQHLSQIAFEQDRAVDHEVEMATRIESLHEMPDAFDPVSPFSFTRGATRTTGDAFKDCLNLCGREQGRRAERISPLSTSSIAGEGLPADVANLATQVRR